MSQILDTLYLGSYADAKNESFLKSTGITHIVTVGVELKTHFPQKFKYLYIPAYDDPSYNLSLSFDLITDFIHKAIEQDKGKVLVHCYWGISRSTTSVLAYLMKYQGMTPSKARQFVKSKRTIIYPNEGFLKQLEIYAKTLGMIKEKPDLARSRSMMSKTVARLYPFPLGRDVSPNERKVASLTSIKNDKGDAKKEYKEYHCKNCSMKVFNTNDVLHGGKRAIGSFCQAYYVKYLPWMGYLKNTMGKVFCPNTKCNSMIGFMNKTGGKCPCGVKLEKVYALYLEKIVAAKPKSEVALGA